MTTPHKHAEVIKAWADGKVIQYSTNGEDWKDASWRGCGVMSWYEHYLYRIKAEDIVQYRGVKKCGQGFTTPWTCLASLKNYEPTCHAFIKVVYDGSTLNIKSIEILPEE